MTIVLLHGFTGAPDSFDALVRALPARDRALRPTLSGHGRSPALASSWDDEIDRLVTLLRDERVARAHLIGYSLGGRVAYGLLRAAPELFDRATLIGAHPGLTDPDARDARRRADARLAALLEDRGLEAFLEVWEALPLFSTQASLPSAVLDAQRKTRRSHRAEGLAHALRVLGLAEMPPIDPSALSVPVRRVRGALDTSLAATTPADVVIPGVGHNVLLERPEAVLS